MLCVQLICDSLFFYFGSIFPVSDSRLRTTKICYKMLHPLMLLLSALDTISVWHHRYV